MDEPVLVLVRPAIVPFCYSLCQTPAWRVYTQVSMRDSALDTSFTQITLLGGILRKVSGQDRQLYKKQNLAASKMRVSFPLRLIVDSFFISDMKKETWKRSTGGVLSCVLSRLQKREGASQTKRA